MPDYFVTDPDSGRKLRLTGDSPPTEAELIEIFASTPIDVAAGGGMTREQRISKIADLEAEQAALPKPSFAKEVIGGTAIDLLGLPEAALQMGTGGLATAAGGVAALPVMAVDAVRNTDLLGNTGSGDAFGAGRAVIDAVQEAGTFQPKFEAGQRATEAVSAPLETFEKGADFAGQKVLETTGSPELAAFVKTAVLMAPALFGVRRGATVKTPPKQRTPRQEIARAASEEGYVTPPSQGGTTSGAVPKLAEGIGGKIKTNQEAISRNQQVTDNIAGRAVGLPEGVPVTPDVLSGIRVQAGQAYEAVRGVGRVFTDNRFQRDLSAATARFKNAARDFPELAKNEVTGIVDSLRKAEFDAGAGIDAISLLRNKADVAFRGGDKALGNSYKSASNAIEGAIERHLSRGGDPVLIDSFRNARQQIAETYSVQEALQGRIDGGVNAHQLGAQLKKGKPLSGDLRMIAEFSNSFPDATRLFKGEPLAFSPLDLAVGGTSAGLAGTALTMGAGPAGLIPLAGTVARPLLRKGALSDVVQKGAPSRGSVRASGGAKKGIATSGALSQVGQDR